jgi:hypothetical protein
MNTSFRVEAELKTSIKRSTRILVPFTFGTDVIC